MTVLNTMSLMMAMCGQNTQFNIKTEHMKNSGTVCVKVTIITNIKCFNILVSISDIFPSIYTLDIC
jgi:hypothetical protein